MGRDRHSSQQQETESLLVFIVRHGHRSDRGGDGAAKRWEATCPEGHAFDPFLSDTGLQEAASTGALFAHLAANKVFHKVHAVVSSPLTRCIQTASHIVESLQPYQNPHNNNNNNNNRKNNNEHRIDIVVDVGLYEALIPNLFPRGPPPHLLSPLRPWANRFTSNTAADCDATNDNDNEDKRRSTDSPNVVLSHHLKQAILRSSKKAMCVDNEGRGEDESGRDVLQQMYPEAGPAYQTRSYQTLINWVAVPTDVAESTSSGEEDSGCWTRDGEQPPKALVLVTHQCVASSLLRALVEKHHPYSPTAVHDDDRNHSEAVGEKKKQKPKRDAWKHAALALHHHHTKEERTTWPLKQQQPQFLFDTCSVTAVRLTRIPDPPSKEHNQKKRQNRGDDDDERGLNEKMTSSPPWVVSSIPMLSFKEHISVSNS